MSRFAKELERELDAERAIADRLAALATIESLNKKYLPGGSQGLPATAPSAGANEPARQGKDENGNPAMFIPDPNRPGKYLKVK
jgi:hypothetical protein